MFPFDHIRHYYPVSTCCN